MTTTIIRDAHVVTMDDELGDQRHADIRVDGGVITAIGPDLEVPPGATVIDAAGKVALPGLVDSHRHVWQGAIGGAGGKVSLGGYFGVVLAGLLDKYEPADVYAGVLWGALKALHSGVTTVADWSHIVTTPEHADENVRALRDSGIRAVFLYGPPVGQGVMRWFHESTERHPSDVRRLRAELSDDLARVTMGLALRGPEFATPATTEYDFNLARELDVPISIHSGIPGYLLKYRTIDTLSELGLLGPDVHHAHGAQFSDEDLTRIAATGGAVTPCPTIDMTMAMGTFPLVGRALEHGLVPSFGTDTVAGSGADLFSEMRLALAAERARANAAALARDEPPATVDLDQRDVLRFATAGGAAAWGMQDRIGTLRPGKRADIILVDVTQPHLAPLNDPVTTIVLNAGASDVDTVLVDGVVVKRSGRLVGPLLDQARSLIEASRSRLFARADLAGVLGPDWAA
ncbi:TRZ/ATZ family hydrolase [Asanoa ishikariensis]|uniref:Cytosine/adenosine deaminase n=1 Tax=Asanoa ishikariensis TaxID=137265 RepID=A0A1H3TT56_9ACTN|nr:amidohydrolase family protein [Asanoa ishikariensis]GIF67437.1 TRZ/ATZ family hydrolase [Asanoa ishikariensis]SDZ53352.1 Cytosine/adenosine deaminase [Asanoa ishikariensis]